MALRRARTGVMRDLMTKGILLLAAGAMIATSLASASAEQLQYDRRTGRPVYNSNPNVVYNQGRTRIYVSKRSWLDGGTEVLPGDRKFTDYAYPPGRSFATENNNRPLDRQPLNPARPFAFRDSNFKQHTRCHRSLLPSSLRGAQRRSNPSLPVLRDGLLRFARNDGA
jgi:hypothetical protein